MYLESWQVFLCGCVIGTLISFIVLTILIINVIGRIGIKGIKVQDVTKPYIDDEDDIDDSSDDTDLLAKLSFILLNRGCISDDDVEFMMDRITLEEWKKLVEAEIEEMEKPNDNED